MEMLLLHVWSFSEHPGDHQGGLDSILQYLFWDILGTKDFGFE